ncbi:MAG: hypothetical protein HOK72_07350 [Flavobacteriales bacterium]|jgi:hypothetical protein|nr:hypothetical protein [Flavobacteriales bacterium]
MKIRANRILIIIFLLSMVACKRRNLITVFTKKNLVTDTDNSFVGVWYKPGSSSNETLYFASDGTGRYYWSGASSGMDVEGRAKIDEDNFIYIGGTKLFQVTQFPRDTIIRLLNNSVGCAGPDSCTAIRTLWTGSNWYMYD